MVDKSGFYGDVGQAVVGDVKEAPRNSNVVNLTIGTKVEFIPLTKLQRQDITDKVKQLVVLGDSPALAIYRVLMNHFGAATMDSFPGDKYREAMVLLGARMPAAHKSPAPVAASPVARYIAPAVVPCSACAQYMDQIKQARLIVRLQWLLLLIAAVSCGWLLWPPSVESASASFSENRCFVDGRAYSIGSSSKMPSSAIRECVQNVPGEDPRWVGARK